jgi:branched-chain amino acid transport system ATP-binding protein
LPEGNGHLLKVEGLAKQFGGIQALSNYSLTMGEHELMGLIGPNGAGKTTVFNLLSGVLKPTSGKVWFAGRDITVWSPHKTARIGIARTFQNIRLFQDMTVLDNIKVAYHMRLGKGLLPTLFHTPGFTRSEREMEKRAMESLEMLNLQDVKNESAQNLPYGVQRKVEIARALATLPKLLLLDEPAAGMNPQETEELTRTIDLIHKERGLAVLLVEHDMKLVMSVCPRIQVLNQGAVLADGTPDEVRGDSRVVAAYLGTSQEACDA